MHGQISNTKEEFALPTSLNESSGIIFLNDKLITHNDSGGQNELYELDLDTEMVIRTITITNATNVDWEDLAQDNTHIYIGDFGNNDGSRTDLKIYKVLKSDVSSSTSVTAEIINFSYADQSDFTSNPQNTEWDAEALISLNTSELVLISKNWVSGTSKAYTIPKAPGTYSLSPLSTSLTNAGLIAGGTYNTLSGKIYLVGYTAPVLPNPLEPFVWVCEGFSGNDIFSGTNTQTVLSPTFGFEQTEAITFTNENNFYMTSEAFSVSVISDYAKLISFSTSDAVLSNPDIESGTHNIVLSPNPVSDVLNIDAATITSVEIFNVQSAKLYQGIGLAIDMSVYKSGVYLVKVNFDDNTSLVKRVIKQ
ncbi:hypothetical protein MHTCC0001_10540 [Flavobacteriaceae bacterium MHTCC 0001]